MKVRASLHYVTIQEDGSEKEISIPDNYPRVVEMEVNSIDEVSMILPITVSLYFQRCGIEVPSSLAFRYRATRINDPLLN